MSIKRWWNTPTGFSNEDHMSPKESFEEIKQGLIFLTVVGIVVFWPFLFFRICQ
jgi:hypothetical protein